MPRRPAAALLPLLLILLALPARAQGLAYVPPDTSAQLGLASGAEGVRPLRGMPPEEIVKPRLAVVVGGLAATSLALHLWQRNAWWAAEHRTSFHFHDDGGYALHLDKAGHFHATALEATVIARALRWSGLSHDAAALWGTLGALALQTHVEIEDGHNALWGFDRLDMLANVLGAGFFYARERLPALEPVVLKWSYWPARLLEGRDDGFEDRPNSFIDDYGGHVYWVALRVGDVLPEGARPYWPGWLNLAVGVSGRHLQTPEAHRELFLSLDVDLVRLFPAETWLGQQLRELGNFFHLPAPALRLSPRLTPYALFYGQ